MKIHKVPSNVFIDRNRAHAPEWKPSKSEVTKRAEKKARKCAAALLASLVLIVGAITVTEMIG